MDAYKNKKLEDIQKDVKKNFEDNKKLSIRDDQEIYSAGITVIKQYITAIQNDKSLRGDTEIQDNVLLQDQQRFKTAAMQFLMACRYNLQNKYNELANNCDLYTRLQPNYQENLINEIAFSIDEAENKTLEAILHHYRPQREGVEAVAKSAKDPENKGTSPFSVNLETGNFTVNKEANGKNLEDIFQFLPQPQGTHYVIDYTNCTDQEITSKMKDFGEGNLIFDVFANPDDHKPRLSQQDMCGIWEKDIPIGEGVKIIRDDHKKWEDFQEWENYKAKLGTFEEDYDSGISPENDPQLQNLVASLPTRLKEEISKLGTREFRKFVIKTENRLAELLKKAKSLGYELSVPEPVTKIWLFNGMGELHLVGPNNEPDYKIREDKNALGEKLYDLIDKRFEGEYIEYLTQRVHKKRNEIDILSPKNLINLQSKEGETIVEESEKGQILNGINLLNTLIDNCRIHTGDSRDDDDRSLVKMKQILRDAKYSLQNDSTISREAIIKNIIDPFWKLWSKFDYITKTTPDGFVDSSESYQQRYEALQTIFFGESGEQVRGLRELGGTKSSFLVNELAPQIETNEKDLNTYLDNIDKLSMNITFDDNGNFNEEYSPIKYNIDDLYKASQDSSGKELLDFLINYSFLPKERKNNKEIIERTKNLANFLKKQQEFINSLTVDMIKNQFEQEKILLSNKDSRTSEEEQRLKVLEELLKEENAEQAQRIYEQSLKALKLTTKYTNINTILKSAFLPFFVEEGGGAKGENADIYEDIIGYGFFDISDENTEIIKEIAKEIAITVAVVAMTGGIGGTAVAGTLRIGASIAKGRKWVTIGNEIENLIRMNNLGIKGRKVANGIGKAELIGFNASKYLLEAPVFNTTSDLFHAAIDRTSLDNLDINPFSRNNIKTAAFLGAMSLGNLRGGNLIMKVGQTTKIKVDRSKGLEAAAKENPLLRGPVLGSEFVTMLTAEQVMNLTFGHDVIDPETGEIHRERTLVPPTKEDYIQMIGMILAFKKVKPELWRKYEQKLTDGTLKICRSIKRGEFILQNSQTGEIEEILNITDSSPQKTNSKPETTQRFDIERYTRKGVNGFLTYMIDQLNGTVDRNEQKEIKGKIKERLVEHFSVDGPEGKKIQVTDPQIESIIEAFKHISGAKELTAKHYTANFKTIAQTFSDSEVISFLFERGWCWDGDVPETDFVPFLKDFNKWANMESNELSKIIKIKPIKNKYAVYVEENIEGNIKPVLITTDFKEIFKNRSNTTDPIGRKDIEDFKNYCYTKIEGYKTVRTQEREVRESIYNQELMQNFNTYLFSEGKKMLNIAYDKTLNKNDIKVSKDENGNIISISIKNGELILQKDQLELKSSQKLWDQLTIDKTPNDIKKIQDICKKEASYLFLSLFDLPAEFIDKDTKTQLDEFFSGDNMINFLLDNRTEFGGESKNDVLNKIVGNCLCFCLAEGVPAQHLFEKFKPFIINQTASFNTRDVITPIKKLQNALEDACSNPQRANSIFQDTFNVTEDNLRDFFNEIRSNNEKFQDDEIKFFIRNLFMSSQTQRDPAIKMQETEKNNVMNNNSPYLKFANKNGLKFVYDQKSINSVLVKLSKKEEYSRVEDVDDLNRATYLLEEESGDPDTDVKNLLINIGKFAETVLDDPKTQFDCKFKHLLDKGENGYKYITAFDPNTGEIETLPDKNNTTHKFYIDAKKFSKASTQTATGDTYADIKIRKPFEIKFMTKQWLKDNEYGTSDHGVMRLIDHINKESRQKGFISDTRIKQYVRDFFLDYNTNPNIETPFGTFLKVKNEFMVELAEQFHVDKNNINEIKDKFEEYIFSKYTKIGERNGHNFYVSNNGYLNIAFKKYLNSMNQQIPEEWIDEYKNSLPKGHKDLDDKRTKQKDLQYRTRLYHQFTHQEEGSPTNTNGTNYPQN